MDPPQLIIFCWMHGCYIYVGALCSTMDAMTVMDSSSVLQRLYISRLGVHSNHDRR